MKPNSHISCTLSRNYNQYFDSSYQIAMDAQLDTLTRRRGILCWPCRVTAMQHSPARCTPDRGCYLSVGLQQLRSSCLIRSVKSLISFCKSSHPHPSPLINSPARTLFGTRNGTWPSVVVQQTEIRQLEMTAQATHFGYLLLEWPFEM